MEQDNPSSVVEETQIGSAAWRMVEHQIYGRDAEAQVAAVAAGLIENWIAGAASVMF